MDNLQELFSYQPVPAANCGAVHPSAQANGQNQIQLQPVQQSQQVAYTGGLQATCTAPSCDTKESTIYATAASTTVANSTSLGQQQNNLNLHQFNYDPNSQWISMPVLPAAQQNAQVQQIQQSSQPTHTIQIQTANCPATVHNLGSLHGVNVQRAQTVATYQQPSGETINVAIIQPLFIVNDQQSIIQQLESLPAPPAQVAIAQPSVAIQDSMVFPTPPPTAALVVSAETAPPEAPIAPTEAPVSSEPEKPKRKPRRPPEMIKAQREEFERQKIQRHSVKPPCSCKLRCFEKLSEARRLEINRQYWQLPYDKQREFILHSVEILDVKRRKKRKAKQDKGQQATEEAGAGQDGDGRGATAGEEVDSGQPDEENDQEDGGKQGNTEKFRRGWTRAYSLKGDNGKFLTVCKAMFLTTLGFPEKVDGALRFLNKQQKGDIRARSPQRGKATPMKGATAKIDRDVIKAHILSYKPSVVGRKKGQVRSLPGDLSIKKMHTDFRSRYTERNVSYTIYSEVFRSLNIVFRKDAKLS